MNNNIVYEVKHKFRDTIIIPICAITNNIDFLLNKGDKKVITSDKIKCVVIDYQEKHICELEKLIREIYNISAWDMICKWYRYCKYMDSMHFLILKLKKDETER